MQSQLFDLLVWNHDPSNLNLLSSQNYRNALHDSAYFCSFYGPIQLPWQLSTVVVLEGVSFSMQMGL
jgi:hypothetical protein